MRQIKFRQESRDDRDYRALASALVFFLLTSSVCFSSESASRDRDVRFFVSSEGSDSWSGALAIPNSERTDGPFASFERAKDAVREAKGNLTEPRTITVEVFSGRYDLPNGLNLTSEDGGFDDEHPVIWRSAPGESVQVNGGIFLTGARKVSDERVLDKLKFGVRDKIVVFDLSEREDLDLGTAKDGPELFFQGRPMRVCRYPNEDFVKIVALESDGTTEVDVRGTKGIREGVFYFDDEEIANCSDEKDLWARGYWFWDWSSQDQPVISIDPEKKRLVLDEPFHVYGYRAGQWFYLFNALRELDAPGEYYIDRESKKLYAFPLNEEWKDGDFMLTRAPNLLELDNVQNAEWSGFEMCGARGDAVLGKGTSRSVVIANCAISNCGGSGVAINGERCRVSECELWNLGRGGISVSGGDRATLRSGENRIAQNYVHDYARVQRVYAPGISVSGVGALVSHNLIENAPHMGIGFSGNDHVIEFNEIDNVCLESNDAGAVYTGRNWTMRGNVLRNNYLHDISGFRNNGCVGIYLDDMFSSADIVGNLFVNVTRAAFIGGGRDCKINDNVFVDCKPALHIDARGDGWAGDHIDGWLNEANEKGTISGIKYDQPPYSERYPKLASILAEGSSPRLPEGNEVCGNICAGGFWDVNRSGQWQGDTIEAKARPLLKMERNFVAEEDDGSLFVDASTGDYRLKEDSRLINEGYRSLPVGEMGVTSDAMKSKVSARRNGR